MTYRTDVKLGFSWSQSPHEIADQRPWSHIRVCGVQGSVHLFPLSARPREGHPATHSASQTRVNALLPSRGRRCGDPDWPWIPAFAGMSGVCCTVGASHFKRECLRLPRCLRDFMRPRRAPAVKNFLYERNLSRGRALCWWNELYDPLSSFVPVLEPRPRRGFSFGLDARERSRNRSHVVGRPPSIVGSWIPQPGSAGFMPCG